MNFKSISSFSFEFLSHLEPSNSNDSRICSVIVVIKPKLQRLLFNDSFYFFFIFTKILFVVNALNQTLFNFLNLEHGLFLFKIFLLRRKKNQKDHFLQRRNNLTFVYYYILKFANVSQNLLQRFRLKAIQVLGVIKRSFPLK